MTTWVCEYYAGSEAAWIDSNPSFVVAVYFRAWKASPMEGLELNTRDPAAICFCKVS
jgi:hypothetical protein